jgi:hypothetical protein
MAYGQIAIPLHNPSHDREPQQITNRQGTVNFSDATMIDVIAAALFFFSLRLPHKARRGPSRSGRSSGERPSFQRRLRAAISFR